MDIRNELLGIVTDYVDLPVGEIDTAANMKMETGIDSFVMLSMVSAIEEHFKISIPNQELASFVSLNDIITYIGRHVS